MKTEKLHKSNITLIISFVILIQAFFIPVCMSAKNKYSIVYYPQNKLIHVTGKIEIGITKKLKKILNMNDVKGIILDSSGGKIDVGLQISRLIEKFKLDTYSLKGCYSACTLAYIAGEQRFLPWNAKLGFHQISTVSIEGDIGGIFYRKLRAREYSLKKKFLKAGVEPSFVDRMFDKPPDKLWFPEFYELINAKFIHEHILPKHLKSLLK